MMPCLCVSASLCLSPFERSLLLLPVLSLSVAWRPRLVVVVVVVVTPSHHLLPAFWSSLTRGRKAHTAHPIKGHTNITHASMMGRTARLCGKGNNIMVEVTRGQDTTKKTRTHTRPSRHIVPVFVCFFFGYERDPGTIKLDLDAHFFYARAFTSSADRE